MQLKGSRSRSPESSQMLRSELTSVTGTSEDRKPAAYQIMLATSHRQRAKIRRNGDHRSPRRLKKKGSYSEKTYPKEPKRSGQQLDLRLLRKDPMKVGPIA